MFLKAIHLSNIKCFDKLDLSFEEEVQAGKLRKWTMLLGENGTGKSTLLKAIALVTCGSDALSDLLLSVSDWIRYGEQEGLIEAVLVTKQGQERKVQLRLKYTDSRTDVIIRNRDSLSWLDRALREPPEAPEAYFVVGFGASRRFSESWHGKTSPFWNSRAQNVATLFDPDATLNPLESWAMQLDYQHSHGAELVREVLDDFLPEISFNRIDKLQGRLLFNTQDGIVPLQSLSDGYLSLAAWVGDLLYRVMSQSKLELTQKMNVDGEGYLPSAPLEAKGLLLIDEVDLHFHPKWQRQLFEFLNTRLPNFQLIVTTHSPMTAQQAKEDQLIIMTRDASCGKIAAVNFIGNPRSLLINQLLMSDVFGLDSDESLEVQEKKARYRKLRDKEHLSANEQRELAKLTTELSSRPVGGRSNLRLQEEEVELLRQIQKELEEQKS